MGILCMTELTSSSSLELPSSPLPSADAALSSPFFMDRRCSRSSLLRPLFLFLRSDFFPCLLFDLRFFSLRPSSFSSSRPLFECFRDFSGLSDLSEGLRSLQQVPVDSEASLSIAKVTKYTIDIVYKHEVQCKRIASCWLSVLLATTKNSPHVVSPGILRCVIHLVRDRIRSRRRCRVLD